MGRLNALLAAGAVALAVPTLAHAYKWPVEPFDQAHAIRGAFDDPREHVGIDGGLSHSFHFGVDICAPDLTTVYAVAPGTIYRYSDAVAVKNGPREFSYWHVTPTRPEHSFVKKGEAIGFIRPGWGHVHFAESIFGIYVNPLRPGALHPFDDDTTPVIQSVDVSAHGSRVNLAHVTGRIDLIVEAYDVPTIRPPAPWDGARWTPSLIRWRIVRGDPELVPWRTAVDFGTLLPPSKYDHVYAPGTRQNHPGRSGLFRFWLSHGFNTARLPAGSYRLEVTAADTAGNTAHAAVDFTVTP